MGKSETKDAKSEGRRITTRGPASTAPAVLIAVVLAVPCLAPARASGTAPRARTAASLSVTDSARMTLAHNGGEYITEEGQAEGTIPGHVKAILVVGPVVVAKFTIYASGGTISGEGSGRPKGRSEEPSFQGAMSVSRGTGRYRGAHGRGNFYGQLNRRSYKMYVKTSGTLYYD